MSNTVWVVEQGEYSDYRVIGVFSSQANAQLVVDALNSVGGSDATVDEWPLDPAVAALNQGLRPFFVIMVRDGTVERCQPDDISGYDLAGSVQLWRRTQAPAYRGKGIPDALTAHVWASDETHAIKVTNEHRTRMIATGEWFEP